MSFYAFHPEAFIDLDEIWEFVAAENLDAADRLVAEISEAVRQLVAFPHQGHHRPDLTSRPLRFVLVRDYLIKPITTTAAVVIGPQSRSQLSCRHTPVKFVEEVQ
jgi:plasmid stabilization system protein ParE